MNNENKNEDNKNVSLIILIIVLALVAFAAIYFIFCPMSPSDVKDDSMVGIYSSTDSSENVIEIADANTKELYDRVKKGITIDGKLIEVPAKYMKDITDKITAKGYKITNDTKEKITSKLDEIENTLKSEGKTDINELSSESKDKINGLYNDIKGML